MKTNKEKLNTLSRNIVNKMIKKDSTGWPPECMMYAYQPTRPRCPSSFSDEGVLHRDKSLQKARRS